MCNLCNTIFYMKMNVLQDFHIWTDVTLISELGIGQRSLIFASLMMIKFDPCLSESKSGGETLCMNYWHIPHLICFFTSFVASIKLPRCLSFCLSYFLLNNYWATWHKISIFIQPDKILSEKGKLSGGNSDRNIAYLKHTNFHIYFCELKKIVCRKYLFLQMANFWKFNVYKFQPRQAGHDKKKLLLLIDSKKAELTNIFWAHFFFVYLFQEIWILCIFSVYLFSGMQFKGKFCVYLILQNRLRFAKKMCTQKLVHLR